MKTMLILFMLAVSSLQAATVSMLWGNNFRDDLGYEKEKMTMTIEHFGLWSLGNVFFYYDITEPMSNRNGDSNQFFGGIAPTMSLSKLTGKDVSWGIIKDVSVRVELENGSGSGSSNFRNYFYGLQYDLAIPGFDFVMFNTVLRDNPEDSGVGVQIGSFWQKTWDYGRFKKFKFMGFLATSPWDGDVSKTSTPFLDKHGRFLMTQPQLLWDLGNTWNHPNSTEIGIEYLYAINRYQIHDKDEKCVQAILKMSY
jgi:nucleoside-specific outer membrane channel protein Tsx